MIIPKSDDIERCFNALRQAKQVVFDVETSGLDWKTNFIVGYVFTVGPRPEETWYLPIRHRAGGNIPGARTPTHDRDFDPTTDLHSIEARIAEEVATRSDLHLIGHALKFDLNFSSRHNIHWQALPECTKVNAALLDENQGSYSLENCLKAMEVEEKKDESVYQFIADFINRTEGLSIQATREQTMGSFWKVPGQGPAAEYARMDGISTWALHARQQVELDAQELRTVWGVERRVTRTLHRMEQRGVLVDPVKVDSIERRIGAWLTEAKQKVPEGMNVRSAPAILKYMERIGRTNWPTTGKGNPSFTKDWLSIFPEGKAIITVREMENIVNTFINGHIRRNLHRDNRIHANFNQMVEDEYGTVSGRLSCNDPNLQQIPKRDKLLAPTLRQAFIAPPELVWLSNDYSQQEYRVFADYARAKLVLEAYARDPRTDYHQLVADILGVERDPPAKRINLGVIYNMGVKKLAAQLGVPLIVAQGYINKMRRLMPEARQFNRVCEDVAKSRGYVKTLLGRRRRFPNSDLAHKAGNGVIQGSSADITKLKMAEVDEYLISEKCRSEVILQIHDDISLYADPAERRHLDEVARIMTSFGPNDLIQLTVPMAVDSHHGPSWGHATFPKFMDWV